MGWRRARRRTSTVGALVALVALITVTACAPAPGAVSHDSGSKLPLPVLIIGGFEFNCVQDPADWDAWAVALRADRPAAEIGSFVYDPCVDVRTSARQLADRIDAVLGRTGAPAIQIVAHSQANLVVRWCIRFGRCAGRVDTLVGVAAANHGTIWANLCPVIPWFVEGCSAMTPDGPILRALNDGDETWGATRYVTASSWCDLAIVPSTSAVMDGAENVTLQRCVGHSEWKWDPAAVAWGVEILSGRPVAPLV